MKRSTAATDKFVQERIAVLKADREFAKLKRLLPPKLRRKEMGKDVEGITTDQEFWQHHQEKNVLLSEAEMKEYKRFSALCGKLGEKYGLHWLTVQDLAMGIKHPTDHPRLSRVITAGLDPIAIRPRDFDPNGKYTAHLDFAPPLEAVEIMARVQGLDEQNREEVKACLRSLITRMPGHQILEIVRSEDSGNQPGDRLEINVWMRIPTGYTVKEVSEVYRKVNLKRREILGALRAPVLKRRRASRILQRDSKRLRLSDENVSIYDIIDETYPEDDLSNQQRRRKSIINKRYKGRELLDKRCPGWRSSTSNGSSSKPEVPGR
jgi:hypothetical protein